jgi:hypothetical protein
MPDGVMKKKKKKKTSAGEQAIVPYAAADMSCSALVPVGTPGQLAMVRHANHGKKVRAKVVGLDAETLRVHGVLAKWDEAASESFEGLDIGSGPEWDEVRRKYKQLVDWFISVVKDLFGMILVHGTSPSLACLHAYSLQLRKDDINKKRTVLPCT